MLQTHKKALVATIIFVGLVATSAVVLVKMPVFADALKNDNQTISSDNFYLGLKNSNAKSKFTFVAKEKDTKANTYLLTLYTGWTSKTTITLSGFEKYASLQDHFFADGVDYLFFSGDVGAHSKTLAVVRVLNNVMKQMSFEKNGQSEITLTSDLPHFDLKNTTPLTVVSVNRNYDKDPIQDYLIDSYHLVGDHFEFVSQNPGLAGQSTQPDIQTGGIK